jgi:histone H1/5
MFCSFHLISPLANHTQAPAIVEQPKVLGKTKSGRVTKTTAPPPTKAPAKKRATKK